MIRFLAAIALIPLWLAAKLEKRKESDYPFEKEFGNRNGKGDRWGDLP